MCVQFIKKADRSGVGTLDRNEFRSFIEVCCVIDDAIKAAADNPDDNQEAESKAAAEQAAHWAGLRKVHEAQKALGLDAHAVSKAQRTHLRAVFTSLDSGTVSVCLSACLSIFSLDSQCARQMVLAC